MPRYRRWRRSDRLRKTPFRICSTVRAPAYVRGRGDGGRQHGFQCTCASPGAVARVFNAAMLMTAPVRDAAGNPHVPRDVSARDARRAVQAGGDDRTPEEAATFLRPPYRFATGGAGRRCRSFMESVVLHGHPPVCVRRPLRGRGRRPAEARRPQLLMERCGTGTGQSTTRPTADPARELRALPGSQRGRHARQRGLPPGGILAASRMDEMLPRFRSPWRNATLPRCAARLARS